MGWGGGWVGGVWEERFFRFFFYLISSEIVRMKRDSVQDEEGRGRGRGGVVGGARGRGQWTKEGGPTLRNGYYSGEYQAMRVRVWGSFFLFFFCQMSFVCLLVCVCVCVCRCWTAWIVRLPNSEECDRAKKRVREREREREFFFV